MPKNSRRNSLNKSAHTYQPSEDDIQEACVNWFRLQYKTHSGLLFSVPNGARTSISVARRLVRTGLLKGVPDLFLAVSRGVYHGLFIEMKRPDNYAKPHQREKIAELEAQGYLVMICKSLEEFMRVIEFYFSQKKD